jgi:hypothetical protein
MIGFHGDAAEKAGEVRRLRVMLATRLLVRMTAVQYHHLSPSPGRPPCDSIEYSGTPGAMGVDYEINGHGYGYHRIRYDPGLGWACCHQRGPGRTHPFQAFPGVWDNDEALTAIVEHIIQHAIENRFRMPLDRNLFHPDDEPAPNMAWDPFAGEWKSAGGHATGPAS